MNIIKKLSVVIVVSLLFGVIILPAVNSTTRLPTRSKPVKHTQSGKKLYLGGDFYGIIVSCSSYFDSSHNIPPPPKPPIPKWKLKVLYNSLLKANNWDKEHVILLLNEEATRENIIAALWFMSKVVTKNDTFIFSWSGHGCQVRDDNGDEKDGYDEAICPWDTMKQQGKLINIIRDDELDSYFSNITAGGMCLMFDCCFSGGLADGEINNTITFDKKIVNLYNITTDFLYDINKDGRVIIMSTFQNAVCTASPLVGFPLTWAMAFAFRHARDIDRDGWISAEEAFKLAKKLDIAVSLSPLVTRAAASWVYLYLIYKYIHNYDYPGLVATLGAISFILGRIIGEIFYYKLTGHFILNYPNIVDNYNGNLPIVEK